MTTDEIIAAIRAKKAQINPLRLEKLQLKNRIDTVDSRLAPLQTELKDLLQQLEVATDA